MLLMYSTEINHLSAYVLKYLRAWMLNENKKKRAGWSFRNLFPFVPSEPAGLQPFFLTLASPPLPQLLSFSPSLMSLFPAQ